MERTTQWRCETNYTRAYLQLLHDPCLTPKIAETENNDGADLGTDRVTGGNTGAGAGVGSVTRMRISRRCCISFVLK